MVKIVCNYGMVLLSRAAEKKANKEIITSAILMAELMIVCLLAKQIEYAWHTQGLC